MYLLFDDVNLLKQKDLNGVNYCEYEEPPVDMQLIDLLGLVAGICTSSSIIPQIVKTVKTKQASDISVFMFIVLIIGNSLWAYYGLAKADIPIILTNFLSLGLDTVMLVLKYMYRKN